MKRRFLLLPALALVAAGFSAGGAGAHQCEDPDDPSTCEQTDVMPNWRDGNYVPLFDLEDRTDEQQRYDAQRWRDECDNGRYDSPGYQSRQMCWWMYGGISGFDDRDGSGMAPNEWHAGFAATHCFLFEFAHQCEDHEAERGEGVHDAHGGAIYADICLTPNDESKYCDDGMEDTQVGVTIMDHNACGTIIPIVACTDEYHVIRPFDQEYTQRQLSDPEGGDGTAEYIPRILEDPILYLCGYEEYRGGNPICPEGDGGEGIVTHPVDGARSSLTKVGASSVTDVERVVALRSMEAAQALATTMRATAGASSATGAAGSVAVFVLLGLALVARVGTVLLRA